MRIIFPHLGQVKKQLGNDGIGIVEIVYADALSISLCVRYIHPEIS